MHAWLKLQPYALMILAVATTSLAAQDLVVKVYGPSDNIAMPVAVKTTHPQYTAAAMKAGIEGWNEVEAIVLPDGRVGDVKVLHRLDPTYGLDRAAVEAVKQWKFTRPRRTTLASNRSLGERCERLNLHSGVSVSPGM